MRVTAMALLCALQATAVSAFVAPMHPPSRAVRVAKAPVMFTSPATTKLVAPTLVRPLSNRRTAIKAQAVNNIMKPLTGADKRMFVRWSYVLCLANSLVNSATLIQFDEIVMHMTGPSTKGPLFLASGLAAQGWHNLGTIGSFLIGCMFAGVATAKRDADTAVASTAPSIAFAGILLLISGFMAKDNVHSCLYVAACAGGILNGITSKMTTFRVSHVTGTVTDMGLLIGKGLGSGTGLDPALSLKLRDLCVLMSVWFVGGCTAFWMSSVMNVGRVMSLASVPVILLGIKGLFHAK